MDKYFTNVSVDAGSSSYWTHKRRAECRYHRYKAKQACREMAQAHFDEIEEFEYHQSRIHGNTWEPAEYLSPFYRR